MDINYLDQAAEQLKVDPTKMDDFCLVLLEFIDEPINFFVLKNILKVEQKK